MAAINYGVGKDGINLVYKFLDVVREKETIGTMSFPIFIFGAICCFIYGERIPFAISVPCALVIFISIFIWGKIIEQDSKFLFLYTGVAVSFWSLSCLLIALGASQINLLHGFIIFAAMLLFSIPSHIYYAKRKFRKVLSGQGSRDDKRLEPLVKVVGPLGIMIALIERELLSSDVRMLILIVGGYILFYMFLGCAIIDFYIEIIRRRYNININLLKQQTAKPTKRR